MEEKHSTPEEKIEGPSSLGELRDRQALHIIT
jgi:hypothetical protein